MERLAVRVTLMNDEGRTTQAIAYGDTVDEAIGRAEVEQAEWDGDESWVMTDWEAC